MVLAKSVRPSSASNSPTVERLARHAQSSPATVRPTAEWTAHQLVEALGDDGAPAATHLIRDRDATYGKVFRRKVGALGLRDIVTPKASPWRNGCVERVIGTLRRECADRMTPMGEPPPCSACCRSTSSTTTLGDATNRWMGSRPSRDADSE